MTIGAYDRVTTEPPRLAQLSGVEVDGEDAAVLVIAPDGDVTGAGLDADEMLHGVEIMPGGTVLAVGANGTIVEGRRT